MSALKFDPEKHKYYLDGKLIPSVTEISRVFSFMKTGGYYFPPGAAEEGNNFHLLAKRCLESKAYLESTINTNGPFHEPAKRIKKVLEIFKLQPGSHLLKLETMRYSHNFKFAGTPDVYVVGDKRLILDWKFTENRSIDHEMQMVGYYLLCGGGTAGPIDNFQAILAYTKGKTEIKEVDITAEKISYFLKALGLLKYAKNY